MLETSTNFDQSINYTDSDSLKNAIKEYDSRYFLTQQVQDPISIEEQTFDNLSQL